MSVTNGITTLDLVLMQRHVLNTQLLGSAYKIISSDINLSATITNLDIVLTKALVLGNITSFPGSNFWKFVNSDYVFGNPQNPFPYESSRAYSAASNLIDQDFIALKLGDVNNSWNPAIAKSFTSQQVVFSLPVKEANVNDTVIIPLSVSGFDNMSGYQYSLQWDPEKLEFIQATDGILLNSFGTNKTQIGILSGLWCTEILNGTSLSDGDVVANFKFKVKAVSSTINEIQFTSTPTAIESYNIDLNQLDMITINGGVIKSVNTNLSDSENKPSLFQNKPNPFNNSTYISFYTPKSDKISIVIYNILGDEIKRFEGNYDSGNHLLKWDGTDANGIQQTAGNYLVRLQSGKTTQVIKATLVR